MNEVFELELLYESRKWKYSILSYDSALIER